MRKFLMTAAAVGAMGALVGCAAGPGFVSLPTNLARSFPATSQMETARETTPSTGAFGAALYEGYMEHAEYEFGPMNQDYTDALFHSGKAIAAAGGAAPAPSEIGSRYLPADKVTELTEARSRLITAVPSGQTANPVAAGKAQSYFDCWMEQQEENFQPDDIEYCRNGFFTNLGMIEQQPVTAPEVVTLAADVFFDFDRATLKSEFLPELDRVADVMVRDTAVQFLVWGHTDTAGPEAYNQGLSERRANAVAEYLEGKGVTANRLVVRGFGESQLAVPTPDNDPEPRNRRVELRRR